LRWTLKCRRRASRTKDLGNAFYSSRPSDQGKRSTISAKLTQFSAQDFGFVLDRSRIPGSVKQFSEGIGIADKTTRLRRHALSGVEEIFAGTQKPPGCRKAAEDESRARKAELRRRSRSLGYLHGSHGSFRFVARRSCSAYGQLAEKQYRSLAQVTGAGQQRFHHCLRRIAGRGCCEWRGFRIDFACLTY
jgi:hypothetical protein